jgi:hypothetical protein
VPDNSGLSQHDKVKDTDSDAWLCVAGYEARLALLRLSARHDFRRKARTIYELVLS